jgi:hypothetical protein
MLYSSMWKDDRLLWAEKAPGEREVGPLGEMMSCEVEGRFGLLERVDEGEGCC